MCRFEWYVYFFYGPITSPNSIDLSSFLLVLLFLPLIPAFLLFSLIAFANAPLRYEGFACWDWIDECVGVG